VHKWVLIVTFIVGEGPLDPPVGVGGLYNTRRECFYYLLRVPLKKGTSVECMQVKDVERVFPEGVRWL
jgi:hypothetical protein